MAELLLAKSDGTLLLRVDLSKRRALCIGRSPRCDVVVPTPTVSRRHALLYRHPHGWRLVDLGSRNGLHTEAGNLRCVDLNEDRWVRIGAVHFWLSGTDEPQPPGEPVDAELMVRPDRVEGPLVSIIDAADRPLQRLELKPSQEAVLIGSDRLCDVVVKHPSVGGVHLIVYREGRRWAIAPGGDAAKDAPTGSPTGTPTGDVSGNQTRSKSGRRRTASGEVVDGEGESSSANGDGAIIVDGHRTRRRRVAAALVARLGDYRVVFAGGIRPTEEAARTGVAEVLKQWRQAALGGTLVGADAVDAAQRRRPSADAVAESPESAISAFLGEPGADEDDER